MKFPKNRANVYVVVRDEAILGVFAFLDEAGDYAGACQQEWIEKTSEDRAKAEERFTIRISTFYG